ncbi:MAG: hypothetical protein PS018_12280 [bacterium]|nr:hypothetical protein [bacterium]
MNWAWASSLDHVWRSQSFPMWLTLAAAGFFGGIVLITLLRAEKSVANGALTVITLLAIGVASAATMRSFGAGEGAAMAETRPTPQGASLPQLSCIDDLAGDAVLNACEKVLFGSAESAAAAVAYAAAQISRLTAAGEVAAVGKTASSELLSLRRAVERDRYGLMAYVLMARDHCTPAACPAFRSLGDFRQVAANMSDRVYEGMISRHASSWNAPVLSSPPPASPGGLLATLPPSMPTGKPTTAEFPSSSNTPPVNIMLPEPPLGAAPKPSGSGAAPAAPRPAAAAAPPPASAQAQPAAKKPPPAKRPPAAPAAPVQIAPTASAPTATNEE